MKFLNSNKTLKILSSILVAILIVNLFIPIYSYADEDEDVGGRFFQPVFKLFAGVGDLAIAALQKMFVGYGSISDTQYETESTSSKTYKILYSPGVIFSNKVPGLNANFINPSSEKYQIEVEKSGKLNQIGRAQYSYIMGSPSDNNTYKNSEEQRCLNEIKASEYGYNSSTKTEITNTEQKNAIIKSLAGMISSGKLYKWEYDKNNDGAKETYYLLINYTSMTSTSGSTFVISTTTNVVEYSIYDESNATVEKGGEIEYSAYTLQKTISKWYKALRLFSLVGLLSVLVYVGIRIIISSTGQEKAKYKKMIMDWLIAVCILFVLQYIMAFTMTMVEQIISIFTTNIIGPGGEDILMTNIRQRIGDGEALSPVFGDLIMYLVLVIYTATFTIHYLKRFVYLAFFTIIAPLIALTYPLDKIKDGQAQAFSMWLREYVFNALIPVVHIILYSIFVGSAMDFAEKNPLYAIVCIGFLIPAEKFIRKMFGFDKASTVSQIGAAASGAMVMNAINKINHGSGEKQVNGDSSSASIKTKNNFGYIPAPSYSRESEVESENGSGMNNPGMNNPGMNNPGMNNPGMNNPGMNNPGMNNPGINNSGINYGINLPQDKPKRTISGVGRGIGNVAKKYFSKDGIRIESVKALKATGRKIRKIGAGALGVAALGTFGVAAGVATGDFNNAIKYAVAAGTVGYRISNRAGDKLAKVEKENREIYKEGKWGTEEYNTRKSIQELNNNRAFLEASKNAGLDKKEREDLVRMFHANGITNSQNIAEATNVMAINHKEAVRNKISLEDEKRQIVAATKAHREIPKSKWTKKDKEEFKRELTPQVGDDMVASRMIRLISDLKGDIS